MLRFSCSKTQETEDQIKAEEGIDQLCPLLILICVKKEKEKMNRVSIM
jgi:hypothetical protein